MKRAVTAKIETAMVERMEVEAAAKGMTRSAFIETAVADRLGHVRTGDSDVVFRVPFGSQIEVRVVAPGEVA